MEIKPHTIGVRVFILAVDCAIKPASIRDARYSEKWHKEHHQRQKACHYERRQGLISGEEYGIRTGRE